jgi:hypothetical protein
MERVISWALEYRFLVLIATMLLVARHHSESSARADARTEPLAARNRTGHHISN